MGWCTRNDEYRALDYDVGYIGREDRDSQRRGGRLKGVRGGWRGGAFVVFWCFVA